MNKKVFIILITIILFSVLIYFTIFSKNYINIEIKNNTNSTINNLKITSKSLRNDINIPTIKSNENYKIKIDPEKEFTEGAASIQLEYINTKNQKELFTIIGYTEGSAENVKILLKNYEKGRLIININGEEMHGVSEKEMYGEETNTNQN
ncbi:hypothetical protein K5V21_17330 [Clostridium sardiniense]|uniref:Uncharacterized protein n=1 Tax=Clostridium sardiniense TaxID=29369 RepID=A0ABS7L297_CLOSR|nr:hypothetical protein [Clostridium sardiniense]MBY0757196.1 hypothetical protein [Clostridium sardiniense]MDQ0461628.1 hypothetical protein [Clostridium sardiniense]